MTLEDADIMGPERARGSSCHVATNLTSKLNHEHKFIDRSQAQLWELTIVEAA